jgi:hypothetical protein
MSAFTSLRSLVIAAAAVGGTLLGPEGARAGISSDGNEESVRAEVPPIAEKDLGCPAAQIAAQCADKECHQADARGCGRNAHYVWQRGWKLVPQTGVLAPSAPPPSHTPPSVGDACRSQEGYLRDQVIPLATLDLDCPASKILATYTDENCKRAEAQGCGRTASYRHRSFLGWRRTDSSPDTPPVPSSAAYGQSPQQPSPGYAQPPTGAGPGGYGQAAAPQMPSATVGPSRGTGAFGEDSAALAGRIVAGAPQPNAFAIVVGIEQYPSLPPPTGARADAQRFAEVAHRTLGVPPAQMRVLLDGEASRGRIEREIAWVSGNVPPGGRIYFYFSGHGAPDPVKGTSYLVPIDGDPQYLPNTALTVDSVVQHLRASKAKDVVLFTDACFSGSGGRSVLAPGARPIVRMKNVAAPGNVAMFSASGGEEISGPTGDGRSGLFSWHLVQGLGSGKADMNGDGQITLEELSNYVSPRVTREAAKANRAQHPALKSGDKATKPAQMMLVWGLEPS